MTEGGRPRGAVDLAKVQGRVGAPAAKIWSLLMDFGRPQALAPSIEACQHLGLGEGAVRRVQARGLFIYEQLVEADAVAGVFRYVVLPNGDMPLPGLLSYAAIVRLRTVDPKTTDIEWTSRGIVAAPLAPITEALCALYTRAIRNLEAAASSG